VQAPLLFRPSAPQVGIDEPRAARIEKARRAGPVAQFVLQEVWRSPSISEVSARQVVDEAVPEGGLDRLAFRPRTTGGNAAACRRRRRRTCPSLADMDIHFDLIVLVVVVELDGLVGKR
jgi:hypothetical protein